MRKSTVPEATKAPAPGIRWLPASGLIVSRAAGVYWEAVRVSSSDAQQALQAARPPQNWNGPVIANDYTNAWTFLLARGPKTRWDVPGSRILRHGTRVAIPPAAARRGPDAHWAIPPQGPHLPSLTELRRLLTSASDHPRRHS